MQIDGLTQALLIAMFAALPGSMFYAGLQFATLKGRIGQLDDKLTEVAIDAKDAMCQASKAHERVSSLIDLLYDSPIMNRRHHDRHGGFVNTEGASHEKA